MATALKRFLFFLGLLSLAACASPAPLDRSCADDAMCAARAAEAAHLTAGSAERHGDMLILFPAHGEKLVFTDRKEDCENSVVEHCVGFALMEISKPARAFVVQQFFYEGGNYLLIDSQSGHSTTLQGEPIFSPDGKEFLVAPYDEESDPGPNNLEIWRRQDDGAVLEWAHTFEQVMAEDPMLKMPYIASVSRWNKGRISLRLWEPEADRSWSGSLTRDANGWHLSAVSPR